jgi:hypothetical protein
MRTIKLLAIMLIIASALAVTTVIPNTNLCICSQIQYESDCRLVNIPNAVVQSPALPSTTCKWTANATATGT